MICFLSFFAYFFDGICATNRTRREIQCLPFARFFLTMIILSSMIDNCVISLSFNWCLALFSVCQWISLFILFLVDFYFLSILSELYLVFPLV